MVMIIDYSGSRWRLCSQRQRWQQDGGSGTNRCCKVDYNNIHRRCHYWLMTSSLPMQPVAVADGDGKNATAATTINCHCHHKRCHQRRRLHPPTASVADNHCRRQLPTTKTAIAATTIDCCHS